MSHDHAMVVIRSFACAVHKKAAHDVAYGASTEKGIRVLHKFSSEMDTSPGIPVRKGEERRLYRWA